MHQKIFSALTALQEDFVQFKNHHQSQIDKFSTTEERLNKMEIALKRPITSAGKSELETHVPFFTNFLRKGLEGLDLEQKAMISQIDGQGGFLVPPPMVERIHTKLNLLAPLRKLVRSVTISGNALDLLVDKGETQVGWVAEVDERPETKTPEFTKLRILVHQLYAKPKVSQILLDDASFDVEHWLADKIAQQMAQEEIKAFLFGDGETRPRGILSYKLSPLGTGEWGKWEAIQTDGLLKTADVLIEIFHVLKSQYLSGSVWLMPRQMISQLRQLKDGQGQYLWQPSLSQSNPNMVLGHPVHFCDELMRIQGKSKSSFILFGNFADAYQIVDRHQMHILRDPFSTKPYVEFYTTKRVGGDVINFDALKVIEVKEG